MFMICNTLHLLGMIDILLYQFKRHGHTVHLIPATLSLGLAV